MELKTKSKESGLKLDLYDKKIIMSLSQDARKPKSILAKELGISIQRLEYKTKRLYSSIIQPVIILNYNAIGINSYFIFAETLDQDSLDKLKKSEHVFILVELVERYRYLMYVLTNDISKFKAKNLGNNNVKTHMSTRFYDDDYNPYGVKFSPNKIKNIRKEVDLKKEDYEILLELCNHPLESYIKLAEKTSLDWRTIKTRIERMLKIGAIDRFKIALNVFRLGFLFYFITIKLPEQLKPKAIEIIRKDNFSGLLHDSNNELLLMYHPPTYEELLDFVKKLDLVCDKIKVDVNQAVRYKIETVPKFILNELENRSK